MRRFVSRFLTLVRNSKVLSLPATLALLFAAAMLGSPGWFLGAAVLCYLAERAVPEMMPDAVRPLRLGRLGPGVRVLIRQAAFLLLLVRAEDVGDATIVTAIAGFFLLGWVRTAVLAGATSLGRLGKIPYATRNLGQGEPALPAAGPAWHARQAELLEERADALPLLLGAVGMLVGVPLPLLLAGLLIPAIGGVAVWDGQSKRLRQARHLNRAARVGKDVQRRVDAYGPEVVLYFTGQTSNVYQANMWLETL